MAKPYFANFQRAMYTFSEGGFPTYDLVTNIMERVVVLDSVKNNSLDYYTYDVKDSDLPEIIADKIYGDPGHHWVVLLSNQIINPFYDWVLNYDNFITFVTEKYDTLANAQSGIHNYQLTIQRNDSGTGNTTTTTYQIDPGTYANTPASNTSFINMPDGTTVTIIVTKQAITNYNYEMEANEDKRQIKIIRPELISQMDNELSNLLSLTVF